MPQICRSLCIALLALGFSLQSANAQKISAIVAFGDSLSDLGNTYNYLSSVSLGFVEYSSYYYDQGRWSDGPVWVEDLARLLGFTALQRNDGKNLYGTDFAWGGSTSADGYTRFWVPGYALPNLRTQIESYIDLLLTPDARMPNISETLFSVWSGGNDVIYYVQSYWYWVTPEEVRDHIVNAITTLYNEGGRYFLVPNLPPLGQKPNFRTNRAWRIKANNFVQQYNSLLSTALTQLPQTLAGIKIIKFDVFELFKDVLDHYQAYDLSNVTDAAFTYSSYLPNYGKVVKNPNEYLFWDGTHPTVVGHEIVGESAYDSVQSALKTFLGETQK
jgi:thermolabile hemolysin